MNYKKEIAPLPEGFADAISRTINKLQHMQEAPASRKSDRSDGDTKPQDISGEEEKVSADKKAPARKGDKSQGEAMASVKEETEALEEVRNIKIAKDGKDEKMVNKQELKTYLQMGWKEVKEEAELDEAGCISSSYKKEKKEEIDPVNPKAVKKKFDDRKDKDIDNDGDEDESDEYLHKRRKAISKALSKDESVKKPNASVDESAELEGLDEAIKTTHVLIDTSKGNKVVAAASSEKGVKQSKAAASRPPMSIKNTSVLKIVTLTKPQSQKATEKMIGYPLAKGMDKFPTNTSATQGKRMGEELEEGFSPREIKMAIGIASDKRYAGGNMTGAVKAINKLKKGLSDHPQVSAVLKRQNEELEEARPPQIQKGKAKGTISATGIRGKGNKKFDVMVGFDNGKFSFRITDESGRFQTVGIKQASKMLGEESVADLTEAKLNEAKNSDYTIYHKTFSSAVQHAIAVAKKRGYAVDEDDWDRKVAMGPRKPSKGKTNSYSINLSKNGKDVRQKLQMQVYYDQGRYELNMYIS